MRSRINPLNFALLFSIPLVLCGFFLTAAAYYKFMAVDAAAEQIEFLKNLPYAVKNGEKHNLPFYNENPMFVKPLHGYITCDYYGNSISVRRTAVTVFFLYDRTSLEYLLDARSRN